MVSTGLVILLGLEVLLISGAWWFYRSGRKAQAHDVLLDTLVQNLPRPRNTEDFDDPGPTPLRARLGHLFDGLAPSKVFAGIAAILLLAAVVGVRGGALQGAVALVFGLSLGVFALFERKRRITRRIRLQLPVFIDLVLRSLAAGKAVEFALRHATWESAPPLRPILDEVVRAVDAGGSLAHALHRAAGEHEIREFSLFALAIHISYNYGSNPKPLLENVADIVRRDEQMRRELSAMTGETRFSAWVLGGLPVIVVGVLHFGNPAYLDHMLGDPVGVWMFVAAVALQIGGAFVLWRMMRSLD